MPIRRLIKEARHAIQKVKPVFMMSPLSMAQFLEPGAVEFDLLVIDCVVNEYVEADFACREFSGSPINLNEQQLAKLVSQLARHHYQYLLV